MSSEVFYSSAKCARLGMGAQKNDVLFDWS